MNSSEGGGATKQEDQQKNTKECRGGANWPPFVKE